MSRLHMAVCLAAVVLLGSTDAEAQLFRKWRARATCRDGVCAANAGAVQKSVAIQKTDAVQKEDAAQKAGPAQKEAAVLYGICLRKARIQAARGGRCFHPGGGFGGCRAEGVGSGSTAAQALANCCFTGARRCAAAAVTRGANGRYYACKLFW